MKNIISLPLLLLCVALFGQNCKPDLQNADKITKQKNIAWQEIVYESSFGNSLVNTSDIYLTIQIGRYGNNNLLSCFITKYEESAQNAAFESQYRPQKGLEYYFAFKTGDPLKFTADDVASHSKMDNMMGKLVTSITISSLITNDELPTINKAFERSLLDVVRLTFADNLTLEKTIKDKKAEKLRDKFRCFFSYTDEHPVEAAASSVGSSQITAPALPMDATNNKVAFTEVVIDSNATAKKQLYDRAKYWMINYYKDSQIKLDLPDDGQLSRSGMFIKTFKAVGNPSDDQISYTVTLWVKDGKYKYSLTDFIATEGARKAPVETILEMGKRMPPLLNEANQLIAEGANEVINNLKLAMKTDSKGKSDW